MEYKYRKKIDFINYNILHESVLIKKYILEDTPGVIFFYFLDKHFLRFYSLSFFYNRR